MIRSFNTSLPFEVLALLKHQLKPINSRSFSSFTPSRQLSNNNKSYYVTTPIFYVNASPHIGHLHSTLLADVYTRFHALRYPDNPPPVLCTGTDEHGLKIQRAAEGLGISPQQLCDGVSERFRDLTKKANIRNDIFIRTTEARHRVAVEHVWKELEKRGYLYKSSYAGWYAVSDEAYYGENEVEERIDDKTGEKIMASKETGTKVEWMEEENYKFRLSAFRDKLISWLSATPHVLQPPSRTSALLAALDLPSSTDLSDLSVSRPSSRLDWGIRVPGEEEHTIYVWIDALVNYLTAAGYPWKNGEENKMWPADLMIVGKDIIRFHALYLPAMLFALDLPLPKNLLAHGHWTMDRFKMSKSRGNVADPLAAMDLFGVDGVRCYLMRRGGDASTDADYSNKELERFYTKDLKGQLGNLLNRVTSEKLLKKIEEGVGEMPKMEMEEDKELKEALQKLPAEYESHILEFTPHKALNSVFSALSLANVHLQTLSPWLAATSPADAHRALFYSSETLRISAILLSPVMPSKASELLDRLGVPKDRRSWKDLGLGRGGPRKRDAAPSTPLFPKVETK